MNTSQFLHRINENLSFFKDKKILLSIVSKKGNLLELQFKNHSTFIDKIEKLGADGAGFSFVTVQNSCCERNILKPKQFDYWMSHGDWKTVKTYASFVRSSNLKNT